MDFYYFRTMYRLTRSELRIIEQTKQQGAEQPPQRRTGPWAIVVFVLIFTLLAFVVRLFIGLLS
jgi:apolipoprotein N-acyltransferase